MENILNKLKIEESLNSNESSEIMKEIMTGNINSDDISEFLKLLAQKGETITEISEMAKVMRDFSVQINTDIPLLDTCGTGGSGLQRINTSTISAFLLASMNVYIAKHGNRAQSGRVGSFDLLEALGAKIELNASQVKNLIDITKLGFIFAPLFHPAIKYVVPVRKKLGIKTIFNILGPLTNPASAKHQILGVSNINDGEKMIKVLKNLGVKKSIVCYGHDGLDEITISDKSTIFELDNNKVEKYEISPEDYGLEICKSFAEIEGGTLEENKNIALEILRGKKYSSKSDLIILNSAFGLYVYGKASNVQEGVEMAKEYLYTGKGYEKLEEYIDMSKSQ